MTRGWNAVTKVISGALNTKFLMPIGMKKSLSHSPGKEPAYQVRQLFCTTERGCAETQPQAIRMYL
jgi:hypothetical protein